MKSMTMKMKLNQELTSPGEVPDYSLLAGVEPVEGEGVVHADELVTNLGEVPTVAH